MGRGGRNFDRNDGVSQLADVFMVQFGQPSSETFDRGKREKNLFSFYIDCSFFNSGDKAKRFGFAADFQSR